MSFNESPSLKDYQNGIPARKADPAQRKKFSRIVLLVLAILTIFLWIKGLVDSGSMNVLLGQGAVSGRVLNQEGSPLRGEVFILGMDKEVFIDSEGYYLIEGIPAGFQSLVVTHNGAGEEYPVEIISGENSVLDDIHFIIVTQIPGEN
ncbi:MAG: hypothetical protein DRJ13_05255 [Bacteroidetes bacterium]|nr:MAG: hypothetical protein DRJ13_05255 [Bacteroidota bacterium]